MFTAVENMKIKCVKPTQLHSVTFFKHISARMVLFVLFHHTRAIVKMSRCNYCDESLNNFHEIASYFVRVILSVYNRLVERVTGNVRES